MSEVITTGTDAIRQKLRVLNKKMNLAILARDVGISSDALQAFIDGKRSLPIPVLQGLTKDFGTDMRCTTPRSTDCVQRGRSQQSHWVCCRA